MRQHLGNDVSQGFQGSVHLGSACVSLLHRVLMPECLQSWTEFVQLIDAQDYQRIPFNICQSDISQNLKTPQGALLPAHLSLLCAELISSKGWLTGRFPLLPSVKHTHLQASWGSSLIVGTAFFSNQILPEWHAAF